MEQYSNTDKYLLTEQKENTELNLYYLGDKSYSSQFYSKGKIKSISQVVLQKKLDMDEFFKIIIPNKSLSKLDPKIMERLQVLDFNKKKKLYLYLPYKD